MKNILLITAFLFLGACAKDSGGGNTDIATVPAPTVNNNTVIQPVGPGVQPQGPHQQQYRYGYHYNDARCTTGPQRFNSVRAYCEALRDERRNNYCAAEARYNDFRQYCNNRGHRWQNR